MKEWICNFWCQHQGEVIYYGKKVVLALLVLVLAWICIRALAVMIRKIAEKTGKCDIAGERLIRKVCRYGVSFFALLIILDLFGINTASLLTVLGTVGLAVGLALKDTLSNMATGLVLLITRPYNPGDYIENGAVSGTVEKMGLFTSTLNTPDGIFIAVPNNILWATPVKNYSRNDLRRADIVVSVSYSDDIEKGVEVLTALMNSNEHIVKDPAPEVLISELADSSVQLQLRYWSATGDYWTAYWEIKRQLKSTLENAGLSIPFPQRVVKVIGETQSK